VNSKQVERLVSKLGPRSAPDLHLRFQLLRDAGLLPTGGRGPHAPDLNDTEISLSLLAAGGSRKAVDVVQAVKAFAGLVPVHGTDASFARAPTLLDALTAAVATRAAARSVERIMLWQVPFEGADLQRRIPAADILWREGKESCTAQYLPPDIAKEVRKARNARWGTMMHDVVIFGPGLLHQIVIEREDPEHGLLSGAVGRFVE
jgi:hypothetical protein